MPPESVRPAVVPPVMRAVLFTPVLSRMNWPPEKTVIWPALSVAEAASVPLPARTTVPLSINVLPV